MVQGLGFRVSSLGLRVSGLGVVFWFFFGCGFIEKNVTLEGSGGTSRSRQLLQS